MAKPIIETHYDAFKGIHSYAIFSKSDDWLGIINVKNRRVFIRFNGGQFVSVIMRGSGYNYIRAGVNSAAMKALEILNKKEDQDNINPLEKSFWEALVENNNFEESARKHNFKLIQTI